VKTRNIVIPKELQQAMVVLTACADGFTNAGTE